MEALEAICIIVISIVLLIAMFVLGIVELILELVKAVCYLIISNLGYIIIGICILLMVGAMFSVDSQIAVPH